MPAPTLPVEVPAADLQRDPDGLLIKESDTGLVLGIPPDQQGRPGCWMAVPLLAAIIVGGMTLGLIIMKPLPGLLMCVLTVPLTLVFGTLARRAWRGSQAWDWVTIERGEVTLILPDGTDTWREEHVGRAWGPRFDEHRIVVFNSDDRSRRQYATVYDLMIASDAGERRILRASGQWERMPRRVFDLLVAHLPAGKPAGDPPPPPSPSPDAPLERQGW